MLKDKGADLVFIIDKSGSMYSEADDAIGGFNSVLQRQKERGGSGKAAVTLFDTETQTLCSGLPVRNVPELDRETYVPGGATALLDAVGKTLTEAKASGIGRERPVLVAVITDGQENASREYDKKTVKKMVADLTEEGWEFIFLGAGIDAFTEASGIGIAPQNAVRFSKSSLGMASAFDAVSNAAAMVEEKGRISADWAKSIEKLQEDDG